MPSAISSPPKALLLYGTIRLLVKILFPLPVLTFQEPRVKLPMKRSRGNETRPPKKRTPEVLRSEGRLETTLQQTEAACMPDSPLVGGLSAMSLDQLRNTTYCAPEDTPIEAQSNPSESSQCPALDQTGAATRSSEFLPARETRIAPVYSTPFVPAAKKLERTVSESPARVEYLLIQQKNRGSLRADASSIEKVLFKARLRHSPT
jgi:hypothetical protein